jgi:hypothetical protein
MVPTLQEKIVAVQSNNTQVKEVVVNRDKIVEVEKLITKTDTQNYIQDQIKTIDRFEDRSIPVFSTVEKIVEVPHILEKIVEKIVIMPQVVEVLKYVHEIVEEGDLGVAVGVDVSIQEARYKELYGTLKVRFEGLLTELRRLRTQNPNLKATIDIIEKFLLEFDRLAQFQRIVQVNRDKIVEVDRNVPVLVPTRDALSIRTDLANALLIEKLVLELRRLRKENPGLRFNLDEDVQLIFFSELGSNLPGNLTEEVNAQLKSYTDSMWRKFTTIGGQWTTDHELMLATILQERFTLANLIKQANLEIEKSRAIADKRLEGLRKYKLATNTFEQKYKSLEGELNRNLGGGNVVVFSKLFGDFNNFLNSEIRTIHYEEEPIAILGEITGSDGNFLRLESVLRERDAENRLLREKLLAIEKEKPSSINISTDQSRTIQNLRNEINNLTSQLSTLRAQSSVSVNISANTQEYEIKIKTLNSRIQELESQLRTVRIDYEGQIRAGKTESEKALRESQLQNSEFQRKIANYENQIASLNKTIDDYKRRVGDLTALVSKTGEVVPSTPVSSSQISASLTSSGKAPASSATTTPGTFTSGYQDVSASRPTGYGTTASTATGARTSGTATTYGSTGAGLSGATGLATSLSGAGLSSSGTYTTGGATSGATVTGASTSYGASGATGYGATTGASGTGYSSGVQRASSIGLSGSLSGAGLSGVGLSGSLSGAGLSGSVTGSASYSSSGAGGASGATYYSSGTSGSTYTPGSYSSYKK